MRSLLLLTLVSCLYSSSLLSQHIIKLPQPEIKSYDYEITELIDLRKNQTNTLGIARVGAFNRQEPVVLQGDIKSLEQYLKSKTSSPEGEALRIELLDLHVGEEWGTWAESAQTRIGVRVLQSTQNGFRIVYNDTIIHERASVEATKYIEPIFEEAIDILLDQINESVSMAEKNEVMATFQKEEVAGQQEKEPEEEYEFDYIPMSELETESKETKTKKQISEYTGYDLTLGYQIGGITAFGAELEWRFHKIIGIHAGMGIAGYGFGTKIHFKSTSRGGGYINLSFKDGGMGLIHTLGPEIGTNKLLGKKKRVGLVIQGGIHGILSINQEFEEELFDGNEAPGAILMFGIGLNFPF